jgi:sec-independent protein translocase protein TatC
MAASNSPPPSDKEMPFLSHLIELRERLLRSVLVVLGVFLSLVYFANDIYSILAAPLVQFLPQGSSMVAIDVITPILTPLKLTLIVSVYITMPYLLYEVWSFVAPALYKHEKQLVMPLMASSTILYFLGMLFCYFFVFPLIFQFLVGVVPQGVEMATDISRYLDFVLGMFFAFGIAFETPVLIVLLVLTGIVSPATLDEQRPYIVVIIFAVAMFLTPPDVFSQTLLALPMWFLFEAGLYFSRYLLARKAAREATEQQAGHEAEPEEEYRPMSEEEMDAELARMEAEESAAKEAARKKLQ